MYRTLYPSSRAGFYAGPFFALSRTRLIIRESNDRIYLHDEFDLQLSRI